MKVTQELLANELGLSRNTVSKVLNREETVSDETKEKVLKLAQKYNYKFKESQKTLLSGKLISILAHYTADENNSFWITVISGVEQVLSANGYKVTINFVHKIDRKIESPDIAGYIVMGLFNSEDYKALSNFKSPAVVIDVPRGVALTSINKDILLMENVESMQTLTTHLIDMGHKNIGFIGNIDSARSYYDRYRGFKKAMIKKGLPIKNEFCLLSFNEVFTATNVALTNFMNNLFTHSKECPTAFVFSHDTLALTAINIFSYMGLSVPKDISVVGFDDVDEAFLRRPKLTTVKCHKKELGMKAATELIWRMLNPLMPCEIVKMGTTVMYRETVARIE